MTYRYSDLTYRIIGIAMQVHREIGPGFRENIYQRALSEALRSEGYEVELEKPFSVSFRGRNIGMFRVDLCVDDTLIIELKAIADDLNSLSFSQIVSYLKASSKEIGLLMNFGKRQLEVKRFAHYKGFKKSV